MQSILVLDIRDQSACSANDIIQEVACCEDSFNVVMSHLVINYAVEDTLH